MPAARTSSTPPRGARPTAWCSTCTCRGMSGLQVLRKLQAARPARCRSWSSPRTMSPRRASSASPRAPRAYLRKPLDDRLLLNAISAALRLAARSDDEMTMLTRFAAVACGLLGLSLPGRRRRPSTKSASRASITLGYIDGAAPFSYADGNGEPQGYSVELCRAVADGIAAQLKRESLKVRWVKLTIQNRIDAVRTRQGRPRVQHHHLDAVAPAAGRLQPGHLRRRRQPAGAARSRTSAGSPTSTASASRRSPAPPPSAALRAALTRRMVKAELVAIKTRDEGLALLREGQVDGARLRPHRADRRGGDERPRRAAASSCSTRTSRSSSTR